MQKQPPIRVLRVIARMNVGGPAFLIKGLMKRLNAFEYDQTLLTGHCNPNENEISGVNELGRVVRVESLQREINLKSDYLSILQIKKNINSLKPEIIHTHTFKAGFLVRLIFLVKRKKSLVIIHHYHGHLIEGYFGGAKKFVYLWIERILSSRTNLILTDGRKVANDLIRAGVGKTSKFITVLPGVEEPTQFSTRIKKDKGNLVVGFVGRFAQIKRPDKFLSVVEKIFRDCPNIEFRMYGDGELRNSIENDSEKKKLPIKFFDFASSAYDILSLIDVLLLTSDNEGTPLTVMEASFLGVPCIAPNVGAISEIVVDNINGIIVDNSIESLAEATLSLVHNRKSLEALSLTSSEYAMKNFSMTRYSNQINSIYDEALSSRDSEK